MPDASTVRTFVTSLPCIDLLVEETADLQHIIFTDNTVGQNTLFQKLHFISPSKS